MCQFATLTNYVNVADPQHLPYQEAALPTTMKNDSHTTPEKAKLTRKEYEGELRKLQVELCKLQDWVKHEGLRVIVIFEGRDAAGKGGTIKAITERVSPRV